MGKGWFEDGGLLLTQQVRVKCFLYELRYCLCFSRLIESKNRDSAILAPFSRVMKMVEQRAKPRGSPSAQSADESEINTSIYKELRKLAAAKMRIERNNHTLQPTALVHEAYLRLADQPGSIWKDRSRILGLAAHAMRHILVDYARAHSAEKRGAGAIQVTLDDGLAVSTGTLVDVLAIDEALTRLAKFDARQARVLELHFFAGLPFDEIAVELGVSARTVKSDWTMARAWLHRQLSS
jgi:RNA polymerase sigma-70 factor (ECF subfamily)